MFTGEKFDPGTINIATQQTLAICLAFTTIGALIYTIFQKVSCFSRNVDKSVDSQGKFTESRSVWSSICCKSVFNSLCNNAENDVLPYDDIVTVKSMDISEVGIERQLPPEVNSAALATAQFLQGEIFR